MRCVVVVNRQSAAQQRRQPCKLHRIRCHVCMRQSDLPLKEIAMCRMQLLLFDSQFHVQKLFGCCRPRCYRRCHSSQSARPRHCLRRAHVQRLPRCMEPRCRRELRQGQLRLWPWPLRGIRQPCDRRRWRWKSRHHVGPYPSVGTCAFQLLQLLLRCVSCCVMSLRSAAICRSRLDVFG